MSIIWDNGSIKVLNLYGKKPFYGAVDNKKH